MARNHRVVLNMGVSNTVAQWRRIHMNSTIWIFNLRLTTWTWTKVLKWLWWIEKNGMMTKSHNFNDLHDSSPLPNMKMKRSVNSKSNTKNGFSINL